MPAQKKNLKNKKKSLLVLYCLGLLLAISSALPVYIQSNFLKQFVSIDFISVFYIIANAISVAAIIIFPRFIKKLTNYRLTKIVLFAYAASLFGLAFPFNIASILVSLVLFTVCSNLIWINMDVLVEEFSSLASTGKTRAIYWTFINVGWIMSPLATTFLIGKNDYTISYLIAGLLVIPFFLIFLYQAKNLKDTIKYKKEGIITSLRDIWRNSNLRGIFFVAFLLQLFYSTAVIYIPLHLFQNLSMSWALLGPIFTVMLIPFIIIEIPAGIIADKYIGETEMMAAGFFIIALSLFLFYYIRVPNFWLWMAVLFFSRIGAALVESMREAYFFKIVGIRDIAYVNIFRTTAPLAYIVGPIISIFILRIWPMSYLFLVMAVIMLSGIVFSLSLKDTK